MHEEDFLIKCVLLLRSKQQPDEQQEQATIHRNRVGFNSSDAPYLERFAIAAQEDSDVARLYVKTEMQRVVFTMLKYATQLCNYLSIEEITG